MEVVMKKFYLVILIIIMIKCASVPIRVDLPETISPPNPNAINVADLSFTISPGESKDFYYKFADKDTLIFSAWAVKGKDISEMRTVKWPETPIFNLSAKPQIENKKISVDRKSVYQFIFTNSGFWSSKTYRFVLFRVPVSEKVHNFNTAVDWVTLYDTNYVSVIESSLVRVDTISQEITNPQINVGSRTTGGNSRVYIPITLPAGTAYWVYWIGVGQDAARGLQAMSSSLPQAATILGLTPVAAFAVGLIPALFKLSQGSDINYYFISDNTNLNNFLNNSQFYSLKSAQRAITDYTRMETPNEGTFYLALDNSYSIMTSKTVTIKIVAVKFIPQYNIREVQKPVVKTRVVPKIEE